MSFIKTDLHCHTTASDGALTPLELITRAHEYEVKRLAITDHDTTYGYEQVRQHPELKEIELISGVEISCSWLGHTIHIVALNVQWANPRLQQGLADIRALRKQRAQEMCAKFSKQKNAHLAALPEIIQPLIDDPNTVIGRGHFSQQMIEFGLVKNTQQAFDRFLKRGRIGYVKIEWPDMKEVIQWILEAKGVAVLAHPKSYPLSNNKLNRLIESFQSYGGQAMEVINRPRISAEQMGLAEKAKRFGLHASIGSDFHRPEHHWRGLGWLAEMPSDCQPVWELFE